MGFLAAGTAISAPELPKPKPVMTEEEAVEVVPPPARAPTAGPSTDEAAGDDDLQFSLDGDGPRSADGPNRHARAARTALLRRCRLVGLARTHVSMSKCN